MNARVARRLGVALAAFMAVSLVFSTAPAWATTVPEPIQVGESLAAPASLAGAAGAATAAGAAGEGTATMVVDALGPEGIGYCMTSVVCIGGAMLIGGLYETRDSWMPVVKGIFSSAYNWIFGSGSGGCQLQVSNATFTSNNVNVSYSWSGCLYQGWSNPEIDGNNSSGFANVYCQNGAGVVTRTALTGAIGWLPASSRTQAQTGTGTMVGQICPSGSTGVGIDQARLYIGSGSGSAQFAIGNTIPTDQYQETTSVQCTKPDNTNSTIVGSVNDLGSMVIPSCQQAYPGSVPTNVKIQAGYKNAPRTILDTPLVPRSTLVTQHPDCFNSQGAFLPGTCNVKVWINGTPCSVGAGHCANWQTAAKDYGDTVTCRWGSSVVALSDCSPYLDKAYQTGTGVKTITTTSPGGQPIDATDPGASGQTQTQLLPPTTSTPVASGDPGACGSVWTYVLPWDVVTAIKCALSWAFVPTQSPPWTSLANPLPAGWLPSFPSLSDAGCGTLTMPSMSFGRIGGTTPSSTIVNTCNAPWPTIRSVTYYGTLTVALIGIGRRSFFAVLTALGMGVQISNMGDDQ